MHCHDYVAVIIVFHSTVPDAPGQCSLYNIKATSLTLSWSSPDAPTSYVYHINYTVNGFSTSISTSNTTIALTELAPGSQCYATVTSESNGLSNPNTTTCSAYTGKYCKLNDINASQYGVK